ncbi:hypothetical protein N9043_00185 [bacterium]|nr:hypothetical protein [bacterium]
MERNKQYIYKPRYCGCGGAGKGDEMKNRPMWHVTEYSINGAGVERKVRDIGRTKRTFADAQIECDRRNSEA